MGVCCIVFDIDGMLFEFFMNFLNIEKNLILNCFFSIFQVFFAFHAISNIKKKIWCKKSGGGGGGLGWGGGGVWNFFVRKTILSDFTFYAIFNIKKNIEKCPFTYWLNERWFLQIVNGGGGGVMFFSHFMLFPTFLENKSGNTK